MYESVNIARDPRRLKSISTGDHRAFHTERQRSSSAIVTAMGHAVVVFLTVFVGWLALSERSSSMPSWVNEPGANSCLEPVLSAPFCPFLHTPRTIAHTPTPPHTPTNFSAKHGATLQMVYGNAHRLAHWRPLAHSDFSTRGSSRSTTAARSPSTDPSPPHPTRSLSKLTATTRIQAHRIPSNASLANTRSRLRQTAN